MSKSKYRVISVVGIVAAIVIMGVGIVSIARQGAGSFGTAAIGAKLDSNVMEVSAASELEFDGVWDIVLTSGKPALTLQADAKQMKNIRFNQNGTAISLRQDGGSFGAFGRPVRVEISMPDLKDVSLSGAGSLTISGFTSENMGLKVQGGCSLTLKDSSIKNLVLTSEGACNVDASGSSITNAKLNLQGASNATLAMAGGVLEGSIEGVGHVSYSGTVSSESVRTDGLAKVEKK